MPAWYCCCCCCCTRLSVCSPGGFYHTYSDEIDDKCDIVTQVPSTFQARLFTGHDPARGPGQEVFKISRVGSGRVGSGRVRRYSKSHGSGRVESGRVGLGDPIRPDLRVLNRLVDNPCIFKRPEEERVDAIRRSVGVCFTSNRSFYPSTSSTISVSVPILRSYYSSKRYKFSQNYATEIVRARTYLHSARGWCYRLLLCHTW